MTIPPFIVELRARVGTHPLWLSGAVAVVVRGEEVLLIRRADTGRWDAVAGIIEPGEQPAECAEREVAEEAGVEARVERVAGVDVSGQVVYENGDRAQYLTIVLRCRWVSGDPHPVDGEALEARWFHRDALPELGEQARQRIAWALSEDPAAAFVPSA
ncbi:NUDIX hydrolase [Homoserinibacter sp. YIM 151385]|uniref:NUDIX hydrolase n=1 Tax=Homoserinibacter sp. YIM 151385 TaxID=2985506 RepID=UPI0022F0BCD6|nr:NUDIX domain-containing protein [Homoserinibacter sp. YIM 151385]WBU38944.1 NUDIX domain-containing protein [Homoserinibacter sp. YIM 151385]